ncbi:hypothetical protein QUF54_01490 [Candidatus Marithioploca araucensis]|uniref:H repeat-associated protein N-terminal domain-containing protein n=1 Tax=Candidatus Marithioploca araucensis TaxID=70273 RepID=A0ABT7VR61_9GAMM|nr:hypothetical protein [Candidatus Marithioploca araucensis]
MSQELSKAIEEHFNTLPVQRRKTANRRHKLVDILVIAAVLYVVPRVGVEKFGKARLVSRFFRTSKWYSFS